MFADPLSITFFHDYCEPKRGQISVAQAASLGKTRNSLALSRWTLAPVLEATSPWRRVLLGKCTGLPMVRLENRLTPANAQRLSLRAQLGLP